MFILSSLLLYTIMEGVLSVVWNKSSEIIHDEVKYVAFILLIDFLMTVCQERWF